MKRMMLLAATLVAALLAAAATQGVAGRKLDSGFAADSKELLQELDHTQALDAADSADGGHSSRVLQDMGHGPQPTYAGISQDAEDSGQFGRRTLGAASNADVVLSHAQHMASRRQRALLQKPEQAPAGPRCYLGCFADTYDFRALSHYLYHNDVNMTIEDCQVAAQRRNYTLFALQNARECWAGNSLYRAVVHGSDALCNQTCTGNRNESCGGWLAFNLYAVGDCPGNFTSSVTISPTGNVSLGETVKISVNITAGTIIIPNAIVDVEVYGADGTRVFQQYAPDQNFTWGSGRSYDFFWTPSAIHEGNYTVKVGVFTGNWSLLHWQDPAALVPVAASCRVQAQYSMFWNFGQWQTTFMSIYLQNWLPYNITKPWNFTMYNPSYSGQFLIWNLQPSEYSVANHTYSGQSAPWQGDLPANGVVVPLINFNVISSDQLDFLPTVFTINGRECSVTRIYAKP